MGGRGREGERLARREGGREAGRVSVDGKHLHLKLKLNFNEKLYYRHLSIIRRRGIRRTTLYGVISALGAHCIFRLFAGYAA